MAAEEDPRREGQWGHPGAFLATPAACALGIWGGKGAGIQGCLGNGITGHVVGMRGRQVLVGIQFVHPGKPEGELHRRPDGGSGWDMMNLSGF